MFVDRLGDRQDDPHVCEHAPNHRCAHRRWHLAGACSGCGSPSAGDALASNSAGEDRVTRPGCSTDGSGIPGDRRRDGRIVFALMAEGRSNKAIGERLFMTEHTVEKQVRNIFVSLRLPQSPDDHRPVFAVVTFLNSQ